MSRILFDQNVPIGLRRLLPGHEVILASELGWAQISNGDLIAEAERGGFDGLVTADRNLQYQQTLTGRRISVVVLSTNHWTTLRAQADRLVLALDRARPASFEEVLFERGPPRRRP